MNQSISIIMPCYNGLRYIKQAVESVIAQTHADWELLISDDGSKDGTREYLASLNDSRIKVFYQEKNLGIFGNLNFLFANASYPISQFLCQDDYFVNDDSLAYIVNEWSELPKEVVYMRTSHGVDSKKSNLAQYEMQVLPAIVSPQSSSFYFYIFGNIPGNLSNLSLRTAIVQQHGWFRLDLPYAGDFEFWSRVGRKDCWAISKHYVVSVRSHSEQASFTLNKKGELLAQLREVVEGLYQTLVQQGYSPFKLKLMASANYITLQRDVGIKSIVRNGDTTYLALVQQHFDQSCFALNGFALWIIYFVTAGGRLFRVETAKLLFKKNFDALLKQAKTVQPFK